MSFISPFLNNGIYHLLNLKFTALYRSRDLKSRSITMLGLPLYSFYWYEFEKSLLFSTFIRLFTAQDISYIFRYPCVISSSRYKSWCNSLSFCYFQLKYGVGFSEFAMHHILNSLRGFDVLFGVFSTLFSVMFFKRFLLKIFGIFWRIWKCNDIKSFH